ncbi:MAG: hypothetical protein ACE5H4_03765 [Candidatus Thorarchaeota archaeon]
MKLKEKETGTWVLKQRSEEQKLTKVYRDSGLDSLTSLLFRIVWSSKYWDHLLRNLYARSGSKCPFLAEALPFC